MGGGGTRTVHHTTQTPNDYNDAWIRQELQDIKRRGNEFSNWRAGREAALGYESKQREANAAALSQLQGDYRGLSSDIEGLGSRQDAIRSDFQGLGATTTSRFQDLTDAQRQQFKDIYELNQQGTGTTGVKTAKLTPTERRGGGSYGGFNRGGMRIKSLNV